MYSFRLTILIQQKAEPPRCLALRATCRIGRLKSSFVPWELSLPTKVAHGHGQHAIHDHKYTSGLLTLYLYNVMHAVLHVHKFVAVNLRNPSAMPVLASINIF